MSSQQGNVFVFVGPPGSGKGSLSQLCAKKLGWKQFSTGNLCRKHIGEGTQIGKEIDFIIKSGKLISDSLISKMVEEWFTGRLGQFSVVILDGYPRTIAQARALNELLKTKFVSLRLHVVRFFISDEQVIVRLGGRYTCQNKECQAVYSLIKGSSLAPQKNMSCDVCSVSLERRKDDGAVAVQERLKGYYKHEQALLDFYKESGQMVHELNVERPLNMVFDDFKNKMECKVV